MRGSLATASKNGFITTVQDVQCLLDQGADIEEKDSDAEADGNTALMNAACNGHKLAVAALLKKNANPNAKNDLDAFPLCGAAYYGRREICELLLDAGADSKMKWDGKTSAEYAAIGGHEELAAFLDSKPHVSVFRLAPWLPDFLLVQQQTSVREPRLETKEGESSGAGALLILL